MSTLKSLQKLADTLSLTHCAYTSSSSASTGPDAALYSAADVSSTPPTTSPQILFLLNMTGAQKALLLSSPSTLALLYTPSFEHFGIVPLEAMASALPVLATNSGGPTETILDAGLDSAESTGLLRSPDVEVWAQAVGDLLDLSEGRRRAMGLQGRKRVEERFSADKLGEEMERACRDAASVGRPIPLETGFSKLLAFVGIGMFVWTSGLVTLVWKVYVM